MKPTKQRSPFTNALSLLFFTVALFVLFALEIGISFLIMKFPPSKAALILLTFYGNSFLAVLPLSLTLGAAISAARRYSLPFSFFFFGIYTFLSLIAQVPLSLIAALGDDIDLFSTILFSSMITTVINSLLFFFLFILGYAFFCLGARARDDDRLFTLRDSGARVLLLAGGLLSLYRLISEIFSVHAHLKSNLYIVSAGDIFDIVLALVFPFLLCFFIFVMGRLAERLFPTAIPEEAENDEDDYLA